jgi:hypothetical protein
MVPQAVAEAAQQMGVLAVPQVQVPPVEKEGAAIQLALIIPPVAALELYQAAAAAAAEIIQVQVPLQRVVQVPADR